MFPLRISYAITAYKCQGLTLEQAVMNLVSRDFAPRLSYIAISPVKALDNLLFETPFDFERFSMSSMVALQNRQVGAIEQLKQLVCILDGSYK